MRGLQQILLIGNIINFFLFFSGIYPSIDIDTSQMNENDLIVAATLSLVHCSLNLVPSDQELQEKVCSLPHEHQCLLKTLLEKFITKEKSTVTKEMIISEITHLGIVIIFCFF